MTETVLIQGAPFLLIFKTWNRYCRICAKPKQPSSIEMEKQEKL